MKKKIVLVLLLALCLCSCGKNNQGAEKTETNKDTGSQLDSEQSEEIDSSTEIETETEIQTEVETGTENSEIDSTVDTEETIENNNKPAYTFEEYETPKTMYAKASVNVRDIPEKTGNKLGGLSTNQEVIVLGKCNETGWYKIEYKNSIGYVSNNYLVNEKVKVEDKPQGTNDTSNSGGGTLFDGDGNLISGGDNPVVPQEIPSTLTRPIYTDISQIDTTRWYVEGFDYGRTIYYYVPEEVKQEVYNGSANGYCFKNVDRDEYGNPIMYIYAATSNGTPNVEIGEPFIIYYIYCDGTVAYTNTVTRKY